MSLQWIWQRKLELVRKGSVKLFVKRIYLGIVIMKRWEVPEGSPEHEDMKRVLERLKKFHEVRLIKG